MDKKIMTRIIFILLLTVELSSGCAANKDSAGPAVKKQSASVEAILTELSLKTKALEFYQGQIESLFRQPLFESSSLREGVLYYQQSDIKSAIRINFQTLKQDDEGRQDYREDYIFDGLWLTHIDYQIKEVKLYQQAEPNAPADVFEVICERFPIIGFSKIEDLKKDFEIELIEQEKQKSEEFIKLHLKVKPDSIYKDDYTAIDFWIDKKLNLPARIIATSTEDDIYEIKLLDAKANEKIDKKVFEVSIPEGFGREIVLLKKNVK